MRLVRLLLAIACACHAASPVEAPRRRTSTVEELVQLRCALDASEVITTWTGTVYAFGTIEAPRALFGVVGMNVARCVRHAGGWYLTSRELMLYVDPATHEPLARWTNPYTGESVPVVHVANAQVQNPLGPVPLEFADGTATATIDVPVSYPNPVAAEESTAPYSPAARYDAGEFFTLTTPAADLGRTLAIVWHRVGPWLPWMNMGDRRGLLVYSARGRKVASLAELPEVLRTELADRVPLYQHAPHCVLVGRNVTSWSYFAANLDHYKAGARFPLPAPIQPESCAP